MWQRALISVPWHVIWGGLLGSAAHVTSLRRLSVGQFHADHAISLDFLEKLTHSAAAFEHLHPVLSALDDIPALPISRTEATKLRHGQTLPALSASAQQRFAMLMTGSTAIAIEGQTPVALVMLKGWGHMSGSGAEFVTQTHRRF
jgi:tRNA pseudouridine55 synthase